MRVESILLMILFLVASASAYHEAGPVGPFNLSFDMNTTMEYKIIVEGPFSDATSEGVKFTRYYLTVDSTDYFAVMALTEYETPMLADINANMDVVAAALQGAGADQPKLYQPLIDGSREYWAASGSRNSKQVQILTPRGISCWPPATRLMELCGRMASIAERPTTVSYPHFPGRSSGICFIPCM